MTRNEAPQGDKSRALFEEAKAHLLRTPSAPNDVSHPPDVAAAHADGEDAHPHELLDRLRVLDGQIDATFRAISDLKQTEEAATTAAKSPASSPEEAYRTVFDARSFAAANEGPILEAQKTIAELSKKRRRVLEQMARSGFFEGRWVNDDGQAVYLESTGTAPPAYELHEAPWGWVKNAPPGEDPRETVRRGPILERAYHRRNQTLLLFGVPFAAYCLVTAFPAPIAHYSVAVVLATAAALLLALPLAREFFFGRMFPNPYSERRLIEEEAAEAQLRLITRGEKEPPSLEEITEAMLASLRKRRGHRETIRSINVVEDPRKRPGAAEKTDASTPDEKRDVQ